MQTADTIEAKAFARALFRSGFNQTEAALRVRPHLKNRNVAGVTGLRILRKVKAQQAMAQELAQIMTPEQVKQELSSLALSSERDMIKVSALKLMAQVYALLTDKVENTNKNIDLSRADLMRAAENAIQGLLKPDNEAVENKP